MIALRAIRDAIPLAVALYFLFRWPADAATRLPDMATTDAMTFVLYAMVVVPLAAAIIAKCLKSVRP